SDARYDHRRIALGPHKTKLDDAREHVGGSDFWRLIQCRQRHRVPEPALNAFGLAQTVEPLSYGDFSKPIPIAVQRPDRQPDAQSAQTVSPTDGLQPRQSAEQVQRRGQRRTFEARVDYGAVGLFVRKINPRISWNFDFVERPYFFQNPKRPAITPHHKMLPVITRVPGNLLRERIGAPPKKRAASEQQTPPPRLSQINGRGKPGEA